MRRVVLVAVMSMGALGLTTYAAQAVPSPTPLDLGTLGGMSSQAVAVSGNVVVGNSYTTGYNFDTQHAFAYVLGSGAPMLDLGTLTGGTFSQAVGVSGNVVVGWSSTTPDYSQAYGSGPQHQHAFAYVVGSGLPMQDLGTLGGTYSQATAVSGNVVVGYSATADDAAIHAFVYIVGSGAPMTDLDPLGGFRSAVAVSGNVVVGNSEAGAFVYIVGSGAPMQVVRGPGDRYSVAVAVSGNVVVGSSPGGSAPFAYVLGSSAPVEDLGGLGSIFGSTYAAAVSGNVVVGHSYSPVGVHAFAYVVGSGAPMQDLGTLGGEAYSTGVSGNVVVGSHISSGAPWFYVLGSGAPMQALGGLGGTWSQAGAVSGNVVVGSASTADGVTHAVAWTLAAAATTTSTTVTSAVNPSQVGAQVTYTATVNAAPDGGTMAFNDGAATITGCASQPINNASGQATCQVTYSGSGSHSITAVYSGNTSFATSTSSVLTQQVNLASTTTTVTSPVNPSLVAGQVTYTATVSPVSAGGALAFKDGATTITGCGAQPINASTGRATCQVTYSAPGTHSIIAVYSGNSTFATSTSSVLTQQVAYGVKLLYSTTKPSKSGASVPIKFQLLNATQTNMSSSTIAVTITGMSPSPAPGSPPSGSFAFVAGPGYQFDLKTTKYPPNTYTVSFKAGADPTTHTAQFVVT